jgi:hypothetical protein
MLKKCKFAISNPNMNLYKTSIIIALCIAVPTLPVVGQTVVQSNEINSVSTAVPFLTIAPDSHSAAMGDVGVATSPDVNSLHWNPAKYAFIKTDGGAALSYSPWLRGLVDDMNLLYLTGYKRIDKLQVIAASLRYFNMGNIDFYDYTGAPMLTGKPNEFAIDAAYSRMFSEKLSAALAFRYVRSDISSGVSSTSGVKAKAGNSFAADIAIYYHSELELFGKSGDWALGADISNIGNKMAYSNEQEKTFLPINLRIGGSIGLNLDSYNKLTFAIDFNKLLVPTPPLYDPNTREIIGKNPDVGIVQGMIQSFYDAPGGFSEEMHEITCGLGLEYLYRELFAVRTGFFHEHPTKGNRRYFTMGVGLKMNMIGIDFSYLISTYGQNSPMNNTLRFTLTFSFGKESKVS